MFPNLPRPRLALLAPLLLASACSVNQPAEGPAPVDEGRPDLGAGSVPTAPSTPVETGTGSQPDHGSAYASLLQRADSAAVKGDYEQALALLERAHRLDPDSGEIYLAMARVHCQKGDVKQCRAVAERGLLYCRGRSQCAALRELSAG